MIIKTPSFTIDPSKEPVLIVFENDADRVAMINNLSAMHHEEGKKRAYAVFPDGTDVAIIEALADEAINGPNGPLTTEVPPGGDEA